MRATEKDEHGRSYTQIGLWCDSGRRSLWARVTPKPEALHEPLDPGGEPWFVASKESVAFIELCAGREGDDAYLKIDETNPAYEALLDIICTQMFAVECAESVEDRAWLQRTAKYIFEHDPDTQKEIEGYLEQAWLRGRRDPVAALEAVAERKREPTTPGKQAVPAATYDGTGAIQSHPIIVDLSCGYEDVVCVTRQRLDDAERLALDLLAAVGEARRNGAR